MVGLGLGKVMRIWQGVLFRANWGDNFAKECCSEPKVTRIRVQSRVRVIVRVRVRKSEEYLPVIAFQSRL